MVNIIQYKIYFKGRWVPAGETDGPQTSLDVDGLIPGHKYKFRVRAVNKQGKSDPLTTAQAIEAKNPFGKYLFISENKIRYFIYNYKNIQLFS